MPKSTNQRIFYNWLDPAYRDFMMQLLRVLEPRTEKRGAILNDEHEEVTEILFVEKGQVVVGYEIAKQKKYCIKYPKHFVVGAYEMSFNQKSSFIYTAYSALAGHAVRKSNWWNLLNDHPDIREPMKKAVLFTYLTGVRARVAA